MPLHAQMIIVFGFGFSYDNLSMGLILRWSVR